jgi:hypothetical protein
LAKADLICPAMPTQRATTRQASFRQNGVEGTRAASLCAQRA